MIIIDEQTDIKLIRALENFRDAPDATRYFYFKLAGREDVSRLRAKVIHHSQQHFSLVNAKLFLCEDGDIFILAPTIAIKDGKALLLDISGATGLAIHEQLVNFNELSLHVNSLLHSLQNKVDRKQHAVEEKSRQQMEEALRRKREQILSNSVIGASDNIMQKRHARSIPELMIIEDDVFSSRLVEKVLDKKFPFTALHTAEKALATYARLAPDILFLDINLPDVSGHELLEKIMHMDPDAYVIMISGNADRENIMHAMQHGAKGFIAKPFNREKIHQYIERCPTIH